MDRHKVTQLAAILEDNRLLAVQQTTQPNRCYACIRIAETLARAIHIEEPRRDRRDTVGLSDEQHHFLLVVLRHRIDVVAIERLPFRCWNRSHVLVEKGTTFVPVAHRHTTHRPNPARYSAS